MVRIRQVQRIGLTLAGVVLAGLLCAVPASAADHPFKGFDSNDDGKITMDEIMRHIRPKIQAGFDALDRNKDGVLSSKDFDDVREGMKRLQEWLDELLRQFLPGEEKDKEELRV